MATRIFTGQVPDNTNADDATAYTLGTTWYSDDPGTATGVIWRFPDDLPGGDAIGLLYDYSTQAELARGTFVTPVAGEENTAPFTVLDVPTPFEFEADTPYIVAVFTPDGYVFSPNFFTSAGVDNEQLHAPQDNTDPLGIGALRNGRLNVGAAPAYPGSTSGNQSCFFPDIALAADSIDATLDASVPAATVSMAGQVVRDGTLDATAPAATVTTAGGPVPDGTLAASAPAAIVSMSGALPSEGLLAATAPAAAVTMAAESDTVTYGALVAMPTTTVTIYAPGSAPDEWSGERAGDAAVASGVPASIIEQARTVNSPVTGTARVIRQVTGRVPDGAPVTPTSRVVDGEGRVYAVSSVRQARNPMWVGDVVLELVRTDQGAP